MRTLAISVAAAAVLFLVTGGRIILIPLLFLPLALLSLRRGRHSLAALKNGVRAPIWSRSRHPLN